jgi:hypothetical protein
MAAQYEHSVSFEKLKVVKERIQQNYTSLQYLQTLNHFLWEALTPIARECPTLFKGYLCKVVARQTLKASAKFTSNDRHKLPTQLFNCLRAPDTKIVELSKEMHINRGLLFGLISFFLNRLEVYKVLHQQAVLGTTTRSRCWAIEREMGVRDGGELYAAIMDVEYWSAKARTWKDQIVEKYTRMAILQAQSTYKEYKFRVRLDDIVQIYLVVVSRAIDRCDSRHGVITTFMQSWFKSAKSEVAKLAEGSNDSSYESLVEDHGDAIHDLLGVAQPDQSAEMWQHVSYVAQQVDPLGLVRTSMGIPQYVCLKHQRLLREFIYEGPPQ